MDYIPHTRDEISQMLKVIGISSLEELFSDIDSSFSSNSFALPEGRSEFEVFQYFQDLAKKNNTSLVNFSGAGFYDHYIPAVVDKLTSRSEFYTPYTPYQPECSQGTLQAIYEYQTLICRLTGMDVANASVYDGGTALAEAAVMATRITGRKKIIIDAALNPTYQKIISTYLDSEIYQIVKVESVGYDSNYQRVESLLDDETAAVIFQNPNFFGKVSDYSSLANKAHQVGALMILSVYPVSLGLLKTPASMGADIVTGEAQCLGNPLNFGGPYLGFIAVLEKYTRQLPGRIVGASLDSRGERGFVLTLQAREQHIRRQKATSNICTNQNLCAIRALIYLVSLGKQNFVRLAENNYFKAQFARQILSEADKIQVDLNYPIFNEFVIEVKGNSEQVYKQALKRGFIAGIPLNSFYPQFQNSLLICVTEKISKKDIIEFKEVLVSLLNN